MSRDIRPKQNREAPKDFNLKGSRKPPANSASSLRPLLAWQIASHLVPGPVAIDFVNGAKLRAPAGHDRSDW